MAFIKKHLCRHLFKYLLSDAISERSKGDFFFVSVDVFRCLFTLSDDESTNLAVIEGKMEFNCSAKTFGRAFFSLWSRGCVCLSLAYHSCRVVLDKGINLTAAQWQQDKMGRSQEKVF